MRGSKFVVGSEAESEVEGRVGGEEADWEV